MKLQKARSSCELGGWLRAPARPWWPWAVVGAAALRPGAVRGRDSRGADARAAQPKL